VTSTAAGPRVSVLGCPLDAVTMDEAVERCEQAIASGRYLQHMSVNAAKLVAAEDDPQLRDEVAGAGLITADGQSVVWAAALLGAPLPERVAGIDLMARLLAAAEANGHRVYILGARREVLDAALHRISELHPRLAPAGSHDGYFDESEVGRVCDEIRAVRPDILFVAMSSPRKERFLAEHGPGLGVPFAMGVGGSVDVIAGVTRRAPPLLRRLGLEWAYRLAQEPQRLAGRYLRTNGRFIWMVLRGVVSRRGSGDVSVTPGEAPAADGKTGQSGRSG
jgi:N-acetylglucosaminyldiphosphoundecaprenol N-acetyl-beta-D-mannosaminyltransferase